MKKRFFGLGTGLIFILFSVSSLAQVEAPIGASTGAPTGAPTGASTGASIEAPKGKTGDDFFNEAKQQVQGISIREAKGIFDDQQDIVFIDVRRRLERLKSGRIEGAEDITFGKLIFDVRIKIPNKNTPIIVYCEKGQRAAIAGSQLIQMGYANVKYLKGGIADWKNAGYPNIVSSFDYVIDMPQGKTPEDFIREAKVAVGAGISPQEAKRRKDSNPKTVILDVATPREHALIGKIGGSLLFEQGKVAFNIKKKIHDANTPIIITCPGGNRALLTAKILKEMGYKNVTYIIGGLNAWTKGGLPITDYVGGEEGL